ncbi:MAG: MATE family efflux transporter [Provencibacterium sp.]|jgi:putative MATE family efflux protein|nr:MATE family efflux transporter [Provencibacterium sp.]
MTRDMTEGAPARLILQFTLPLIFGNLFQQLYSMVDTILVGRFLGKQSLAAVGSTGSLSFLLIGFCLGLCSGFAIPVAQHFGGKRIEELRQSVGNIIWLIGAASVLFTVLTVLLCRPMLAAMNTPEDILEEAYRYLVVIFAGIPATFFYNIQAALLRALGDSRTPVLFLMLASAVNILLDFVLILFTPLGAAGAAAATVISQLLSGGACFLFILKKFEILHLSKDHLRLRSECVGELLSAGVPMGLQTSITAVGSILLQISVNALGSLAVAAVTASGKISMLFCCIFDALGVAMSTYGGQNIGAGKTERLTPGLWAGMGIGSLYALLSLGIILLFGRGMMTLFVDKGETALIENAYRFLCINAAFYIPLVGVNVFRLLIQGMGYSKMAVLAGVCEMIARGVTGLFLVPAFGFTAACFASPIAWILADLFLVPAYFTICRHLRRWGVR